MTARLDIAPCAPADRGLLFQLAEMAFAGEGGWDATRVLDALHHDHVFVARDDGPAGYVALRNESDICVVVDQLLVAPGHERMGVGHRLLEYAEQYAIKRRASVLRIAVESDNSAARSFYRRAGFVPVERELFELDLGRHTPGSPRPRPQAKEVSCPPEFTASSPSSVSQPASGTSIRLTRASSSRSNT